MPYPGIQALALLLAFIAAAHFNTTTSILSFVYAIGLGHYALGFIYGRKKILNLVLKQRYWLPVFGMALVGFAAYEYVPLAIYFGIHHVLSEVYLCHRHYFREKFSGKLSDNSKISNLFSPAKNKVIHFSIVCQLLGYFAIISNLSMFYFIPKLTLQILFVVSFIAYAIYLRVTNLASFPRVFTTVMFTETIYLLLIPTSYLIDITFMHIVCYHVLFWGLIPVIRFNLKQNTSYLLLTVIVTGIFLIMSPIGIPGFQVDVQDFIFQFELWAYIHVTISFMISSANPDWIAKMFFQQNRVEHLEK